MNKLLLSLSTVFVSTNVFALSPLEQAKVDIVAKAFVERYGLERLGEIAKLHFKNTEKIRV